MSVNISYLTEWDHSPGLFVGTGASLVTLESIYGVSDLPGAWEPGASGDLIVESMLVPTKDRFSASLLCKDVTTTVTMNVDAILHFPCRASTLPGGRGPDPLLNSDPCRRCVCVLRVFSFFF